VISYKLLTVLIAQNNVLDHEHDRELYEALCVNVTTAERLSFLVRGRHVIVRVTRGTIPRPVRGPWIIQMAIAPHQSDYPIGREEGLTEIIRRWI
jgi:hypothetical protein